MDPTTTAAITAISTTSGGGLLAVILILLLSIIPLVIKFWNWSKEASAQGMLYQQLSEIVQKQRVELDAIYIQRTNLQEQLFELRHKVENLESCEKTVDILKQKLDEKDKIIAERDARIANLLEELLRMKDRVHQLELRLAKDEVQFLKQNTGE